MLKRFNRLLALAAVLFTGLGLWAAPPATDAPVPNRTAPPTVGGDQGIIVDRATRRRTLAAAREAAAARAQAALKARGGKVNPAILGQNPANADNAAKFAKANAALAGVKGAEQGLAVLPNTGIGGPGFQLKQPDYMLGTASNWHNTKPIKKFVDGLPGLGRANANNLGNFIPVAKVADITSYPDSDYYEIGLVEYTQQLSSGLTAKVNGTDTLTPTKLRGYKDLSTKAEDTTNGTNSSNYLGPVIIATRDRPVRVKMFNQLPFNKPATAQVGTAGTPARIATQADVTAGLASTAGETIPAVPPSADYAPASPASFAGDLFLPVDTTVMGVGIGDKGGTEVFTQNRAELHLHGGTTPWISDGTPHQWFTPAGDPTSYKKGAVFMNVPDMMAPRTPAQDGDGIATYFWSNQQSGRLMFYHDHTFGLTRLNVYAGEAAGYLIVDPKVDGKLIKSASNPTGVLPNQGGGVYNYGIPLIIQDKTFVDTTRLGVIGELQIDPRTGLKTLPGTDPTWDVAKYGGDGSLWFPHVYMPNQNPADISGANGMGRWDYAQWFWPPYPLASNNPGGLGLQHGAQPLLATDPATGNPIPVRDANGNQLPVYGVLNAPILDPKTGQRILNPATGLPYPNGSPLAYYQNSNTPILLADGTPAMQWVLDPNGTEYPGTPNPSLCPEAFMDTPLVNGTPYPTITVQPTAYRFRILNASNDRFWNLSFFQADASGTEVPMVDAVPSNPDFPAGWPTDGRVGGVPDPKFMGPSFIQIGNESGFLPAPAVIAPQPVNYTYNRRDIVVLSVQEKGLLLGAAERADVIVDFAAFAGKTLILYSDAPSPMPAFDPRFDYFTGMPDNTDTGGSIPTVAGYGPNTRTIMQFVVAPLMKDGSAPSAPYDLVALNAAFTTTANSKGAFLESQHLPIAPQVAYNAALGKVITPAEELLFKNNVYLRIQDHKFRLPFPAMENGVSIQPDLKNKAIQELFELDYGRMNATLGVELPLTNAFTQTTIPLGYADPATEDLYDGTTQYWKITHNGVDTHPVHFHLFDVQVINRVGWDGAVRLPDANEIGWKETLRMNPLEDIVVAFRPLSPRMPASMTGGANALPLSSRRPDVLKPAAATITWSDPATGNPSSGPNTPVPFGWEYVWHCHILGHEENDFMRPVVLHVATTTPAAPSLIPGVVIDPAATTPTYTQPSAILVSPGRVDLKWVDNSVNSVDAATGETGFMVQRRNAVVPAIPQVGTAFVPAVLATQQDVDAGLTGANGLVVAVGDVITPAVLASADYAPAVPAVPATPWVTIGTTVPNENNYRDFSISPGTGYNYQFVAYNQAGASAASDSVNIGTPTKVDVSGLVVTFDAATNTNQPLAGVTVAFSNGTTATTTATGAYTATLPWLFTGTVTPTLAGYAFLPGSRTYATGLSNSLTGQDFVAHKVVTISGTVKDASATPKAIAGVTVTLSNAGGSAITAADGTYSVVVSSGWSGTATVSLAHYTFAPNAPVTGVYANVIADQPLQNHTGTQVVVLSGTIALAAGTPVAGVTVTFNPGVTATTNGSGFYTITLTAPYTGTIVPSKLNYAFTPATSTAFDGRSADITQDFVASGIVTVSGTVTSNFPVGPLAGATVTYNGNGAVATADALTGAYSMTVPSPLNGTLTPSAVAPAGITSYAFTPVSLGYNTAADVTTANFVATPQITLSGKVQLGAGTPAPAYLAGATVTFSTGQVVTTNATGDYSLVVSAPYSGTVTAIKAGYFVTPLAPQVITAAGVNTVIPNFTAVPAVIVSGLITTSTGPAVPLAGVTLTFMDTRVVPAVSAGSVVTDANGLYTHYVPSGFSGTITPTLLNWAFTPTNRTLTNVTVAPAGQNFVARETVTVTGNIKTGATNLSGVLVSFSNGGGTATTDVNGNYSRIVNAGWFGTITPTGRGMIYAPLGSLNLSAVTVAAPGLTLASTLAYDFMTVQTIAGRARTRDSFGQNVPLAGVTFILSAGTTTGTFITLADGNFTFRVPTGQVGSVSAQTLPGGPFTFNQSTGGALTTISPTRWLATAPVTSTGPVATYAFTGTANISGLRFDAR